jgi:hypothetical protein
MPGPRRRIYAGIPNRRRRAGRGLFRPPHRIEDSEAAATMVVSSWARSAVEVSVEGPLGDQRLLETCKANARVPRLC